MAAASDKKPGRIRNILSYLQENVPNTTPPPDAEKDDEDEEEGKVPPADADLNVEIAVPMGANKKKKGRPVA